MQAKIITAFRVYDDANSIVKMYRPGNVIEGADAEYAIKNGYGEAIGDMPEAKAEKAPANKARKAAPENK